MSKTITLDEIRSAAIELGVETAVLLAVHDVECPDSGFNDDGSPVILFEPHVFWRELGNVYYYTKREQMRDLFPDICYPTWQKSAYNVRPSHQKLYVASVLHWEAAHSSCSWGLGQVMGNNWEDLGYASLKAFVDAMHESEAKQLDAMCRFIKVNNLVDELQRHDWSGFARRYNGSGYRKNRYDEKLEAAYAKHKHTK
ncbi:N-acetylmuramidase family protein [Psychrobacter celer]|uniref:N-acetylmuramidase family protein n=1 Tax=Psychrobacter celer TaxID=306572 RepID=UPI003FD557DA